MSSGHTTGGQVEIQFNDNSSGKNAAAEFYANGHNQGVKGVLDNTPQGKALIQVGHVNAINLVGNFQNVIVVVKNKNQDVVTATGQATYKSFDNIPIDNLTITATRA